MLKLVAVFLSVLCSAIFVGAQTEACPGIYVEAPFETTDVGQGMLYTVRIEPADKIVGLSYLWMVTTGRGQQGMVKGQGTRTIEVPYILGDTVTVTIRVIGLPAGCPDDASASYVADPPPVMALDEFKGDPATTSIDRLKNIAEIVRQYPRYQLYIFLYGYGKKAPASIKSKRELLTSRLPRFLMHDQPPTFVDVPSKDDRVKIYLVPPGVDAPRP